MWLQSGDGTGYQVVSKRCHLGDSTSNKEHSEEVSWPHRKKAKKIQDEHSLKKMVVGIRKWECY